MLDLAYYAFNRVGVIPVRNGTPVRCTAHTLRAELACVSLRPCNSAFRELRGANLFEEGGDREGRHIDRFRSALQAEDDYVLRERSVSPLEKVGVEGHLVLDCRRWVCGGIASGLEVDDEPIGTGNCEVDDAEDVIDGVAQQQLGADGSGGARKDRDELLRAGP